MIKEITSTEDIRSSVCVIRKSFATVAEEFGLTPTNCPSNAAFIDESDLWKMREKGSVLFGFFTDTLQEGFVALRKASESLFYLEKLAVLPSVRHRGIGRLLMDFSVEYAKKANGERISIGIIDENVQLKNWYIDYEFREIETKRFPHLPFTVCMLEKNI